MKKSVYALLLCFLMLFATGCNLRENMESLAQGALDGLKEGADAERSRQGSEGEVHGYSPDRKNDAILLEVLAALDERDEEALKSIFTPYAMENVEEGNIEAGLEYLFSIYEGTTVEWYRIHQWGSGGTRDDRESLKTEHSIFEYRVTTDLAYYSVVLYRFYYKKGNRVEDGLYRLAIIPDEDYFRGDDYMVWSNTSVAGFYLPPA